MFPLKIELPPACPSVVAVYMATKLDVHITGMCFIERERSGLLSISTLKEEGGGSLYRTGLVHLQKFKNPGFQARRKQFRVGPAKIGSSAEGATTLGGSGGIVRREILKINFSKMHIWRHSQGELTKK